MIKVLLSNWEVLDTSSLMSTDHKVKLVEVLGLMSHVISKTMSVEGTILSETQFLRTIYTLLLDKTCSNKHKVDLINVLKVSHTGKLLRNLTLFWPALDRVAARKLQNSLAPFIGELGQFIKHSMPSIKCL